MPFETFHLFIVDHDNKKFSVEGPMNNDSLWRDRVVVEQMKGRDVRCFSVKESSSLKASIKYYSKQTKYKFSKDGVIWFA